MAITDKQQRFVDEYLIDLNAKQAAIRAGYSAKTAQEQSSRLLSNVKVQQAVAEAKAQRIERTKIDADYVLHKAHEVMELDVLDIMTDAGFIKPVTEWPVAWRKNVLNFEVIEQFGTGDDSDRLLSVLKKVKLPDKTKNLELLGRHVDVQAFKERIEVEDKTDYEAILERRAKKAEELRRKASQVSDS